MENGDAYALEFRDPRARELALVGGKGASLALLASSGLPIPAGFCITTAAYHAMIGELSLQAEINALGEIEPDDSEALAQQAAAIRERITVHPMPADVRQAIARTHTHVGSEHSYAVRSSATAEDLPEASFAGQQDTFLNCGSLEQVVACATECMASLFTDRAVAYRARAGISPESATMAVVVQRMVVPDVSGVLFTADPVDGNRRTCVVESAFGLGEALVSGAVTPDSARVEPATGRILEYEVGDKEVAVVPADGSGTQTVRLDDDKRTARCLTDSQLIELAQLGRRIEEVRGRPQDVEFCLVDGQPVVLQARPITALYPVPEPQPDDDALHVYYSWGHKEAMPEAMPPLVVDLWLFALAWGRRRGETVRASMAARAGGRAYIDLSELLRHSLMRRRTLHSIGEADEPGAAALRSALELPGAMDGPKASLSRLMGMTPPGKHQMVTLLLFGDPTGAPTREKEWSDRYAAAAVDDIRSHDTLAGRLAATLRAVSDAGFDLMERAYPIFVGIAADDMLKRMFGRQDDDVNAIGRGFPDDIVTAMNLELGALADVARANPALAQAIRSGLPREQLAKIDGSARFIAAFEDFLAHYGFRATAEIDLSRPRWSEDPDPLLQTIRGNLASNKPGGHREHVEQLVRQREEAGRRLIERAGGGFLGPVRQAWVRRMLTLTRWYLAIREHPKYCLVQLLAEARAQILSAAEELKASGRLQDADDVWFLNWDELLRAAGDENADLPSDIEERKVEFERVRRMPAPRVITSDGQIVTGTLERDDVPAGALHGTGASGGVAEGRARVIHDPAGASIERGEVLVAPYCDPGWTPLFINAVALVTDVGGLMTHGALVAREYGLPAVVSVLGATDEIHTGQLLRVDGTRGIVEILEEAHT